MANFSIKAGDEKYWHTVGKLPSVCRFERIGYSKARWIRPEEKMKNISLGDREKRKKIAGQYALDSAGFMAYFLADAPSAYRTKKHVFSRGGPWMEATVVIQFDEPVSVDHTGEEAHVAMIQWRKKQGGEGVKQASNEVDKEAEVGIEI